MKTHYHFIFWCCERIEEGTGNYVENATVEVIDSNLVAATKRVKTLCPGKKVYTLRSVIEHFGATDCHTH